MADRETVSAALLVSGRLNRLNQADVLRDVANRPLFCEQAFTSGRRIGRSADDRDNLIKVRDRDNKTKQDMRAFTGTVQLILGAAGDDLFAEAE